MRSAGFALSITLFAAPTIYAWSLVDNYVGPSFLSGFTHQNIADPTHGRV